MRRFYPQLFAIGLCVAGPVVAADLGGECCGDLQQRVAELEVASARKGNRAVSLTVSGEVARAMLIWDDGIGSDSYIIDNPAQGESSKLGFAGQGRLSQQWMTGFVIELGFTDASSLFVDQVNDDGPGETAFELRLANWYIESERLGRLTEGQQGSATAGIITIDLTRAKTDPVVWHNRSFGIRGTDGDYTGLTWGNVAWGLEGYKGDFLRYDSPVFYGFAASAAWGENDSADVALRFQKELDSVRIAAGAGYLRVGDNTTVSFYPSETKIASGSISVLHVPTGLFGNVAAGRIEISRDALDGPVNPDDGLDVDGAGGFRKALHRLRRHDALRRIWPVQRRAARLCGLYRGRHTAGLGRVGRHRRNRSVTLGLRSGAAIGCGLDGNGCGPQSFRCGNPHRADGQHRDRTVVWRGDRLVAEILGVRGGATEN